jgi:hypothetical protein
MGRLGSLYRREFDNDRSCVWSVVWLDMFLRGVQDEYKVGFSPKLYRSLYLVFDGFRRTDTGKNKGDSVVVCRKYDKLNIYFF